MNSEQRKSLIDKTHLRIQTLESTLAEADVVTLNQKQADAQPTRMDISITSSLASQHIASAKRELAQLKEKLKWLQSDDAGLCSGCGCEIPIERLEAVLTTRFCVNCAAKKMKL